MTIPDILEQEIQPVVDTQVIDDLLHVEQKITVVTDPIQQAISIAAAKKNNVSADAIALKTTVTDSIPKLPKIKNPILIAKQAEADAQKAQSEIKNKLLTQSHTSLDVVKKKLSSFKKPTVSFPKLPLLDKKALQTSIVLKKIKQLAKDRQKASVENLKKSKDAFRYPMASAQKTIAPIISDLPTLPKLPSF